MTIKDSVGYFGATTSDPAPLGAGWTGPLNGGYAAGSDVDTTLLVTSKRFFVVTLTTTRSYTLPFTNVKAGDYFTFVNLSAFLLQLKSSNGSILNQANGANVLASIHKGTVRVVALQDTPTTPAHWFVQELEEEGTYTPALTASVTTPSPLTFSSNTGSYVRRGKLCHATVNMTVSAKTGGSGTVRVSVPFVCQTTNVHPFGLIYNNNDLDAAAFFYSISGRVEGGQAFATFWQQGDSNTSKVITTGDFGASSYWLFTCAFEISE